MQDAHAVEAVENLFPHVLLQERVGMLVKAECTLYGVAYIVLIKERKDQKYMTRASRPVHM